MNNHPIEPHEEHWQDDNPRPLTFLRIWIAVVALIGIGLVVHLGWFA